MSKSTDSGYMKDSKKPGYATAKAVAEDRLNLPEEPDDTFIYVKMRAKRVAQNEDGSYTVSLPARHMGEQERGLLRHMFPNTIERVYDLLDTEALILAIVPK